MQLLRQVVRLGVRLVVRVDDVVQVVRVVLELRHVLGRDAHELAGVRAEDEQRLRHVVNEYLAAFDWIGRRCSAHRRAFQLDAALGGRRGSSGRGSSGRRDSGDG